MVDIKPQKEFNLNEETKLNELAPLVALGARMAASAAVKKAVSPPPPPPQQKEVAMGRVKKKPLAPIPALKKANINLKHIDNPVYHLGLESSKTFLEKSLLSVEAILVITKKRLLSKNHTSITKALSISKLFLINHLLAFIYVKFKSNFENNLLSKKPSLFYFDLYRLCYLCYIDKNS